VNFHEQGPYRRLGRRRALAGVGALVAAPSIARAQGRNGVALVVGNSRYKWEATLPNVSRDAPDIAKRFQAMGLKTELVQDASRQALQAAIDRFKSASSGAALAVFYFAGHGASWDKDTYLVPVDADLGTPDLVRTLVPVRAISAATKDAAHRILVFDSCRNNPADGWRQRSAAASSVVTSAELAASALYGPDTLLLFSTAPGRVALDGPAGENSPFAAAFMRQLEGDSVDLATLASRVRRDLLIATAGRQVIWDENTFNAPFMLEGVRGAERRGPSQPITPSRILELPKAYAFAREKQLALPPGLVAIRSGNAAPGDDRVGAYSSTVKAKVGTSYTSFSVQPVIVLVLSVDESGVASTIMCARIYGWEKNGASWGLFSGQFSGQKIEYSPYGFTQLVLRWKDGGTGSFDIVREGPFMLPSSDRFVRLDG
jgi:hypothetical protein